MLTKCGGGEIWLQELTGHPVAGGEERRGQGSQTWGGGIRSSYLVPSQGNCDRDVQGLVDDPRHRFDQGHEEKGKPDDTDEQDDNHASHAVLHHFLFLLPPGLRVSLQR